MLTVSEAPEVWYVDTSALAKLVVNEEASDSLRAHLGRTPQLISSSLVIVELSRMAARFGSPASALADSVLEAISTVPIDDWILRAAARVHPAEIRSLDAIHLASLERVATVVVGMLTYDRRMAMAAAAQGATVLSPGMAGRWWDIS